MLILHASEGPIPRFRCLVSKTGTKNQNKNVLRKLCGWFEYFSYSRDNITDGIYPASALEHNLSGVKTE